MVGRSRGKGETFSNWQPETGSQQEVIPSASSGKATDAQVLVVSQGGEVELSQDASEDLFKQLASEDDLVLASSQEDNTQSKFI